MSYALLSSKQTMSGQDVSAQTAARVQQSETTGTKRPLDNVSARIPEAKKLAVSDDKGIVQQLATIQAQRSAGRIANAKVEEWLKTVEVPDKIFGLIMGDGGEQITKLQAESDCKVQMAADSGGLPERICTLTGTQQSIEKAKEFCTTIINRGGPTLPVVDTNHVPDGNTIVKMGTPGPKVGKGGETSRKLQENDTSVPASHVLMSVFPNKNLNVPVRGLQDEFNYEAVVKSLMYAFGDWKCPLKSSVKLMYQLLQNQMAVLIKKAEHTMIVRKRVFIDHKDILCHMRENKVLLKRLLNYLVTEDAKSNYRERILIRKKFGELKPDNGLRVKICLRYFKHIEKFHGDLTSILKDESIIDHVYMKRLKRRKLMMKSMTKEESEFFQVYTIKTAFYQKPTSKTFENWLQQCSCTTTDINSVALSILHFLARETIAGIVEKALEIKLNKHKKTDIEFHLDDINNLIDECSEFEDVDNLKAHLQSYLSESSPLASYGIEECRDKFELDKEKDYKVYWFKHDAITPEEIWEAYLWYQRPSSVMKISNPGLHPEPNLVCFANPDDLVE